MIHGVDTSFLVAVEVEEHPEHASTRGRLRRLVASGDRMSIAPQVLAEFIHVVTDPRRFAKPLTVAMATELAEQWWTAREVDQLFADADAMALFLAWFKSHDLGRMRLLDTLLAATYRAAGANSILKLNPSDFEIFGDFAFNSFAEIVPNP